MITMLRVRSDSISNDIVGPYRTINSLTDSYPSLSDISRIFMLTEQLVFAKYLSILEPTNNNYKKFKANCDLAIKQLVSPAVYFETNREKYTEYFNVLTHLSKAFDSDTMWEHSTTILNDETIVPKVRQLSKDFYNPFLFSLHQNKNYVDNSVEYSPVILYPQIYRGEEHLLYVDYTSEVFTSFNYDRTHEQVNSYDGRLFRYLKKFNWSGKQFGDVARVVSSLSLGFGSTTNDLPELVSVGILGTAKIPNSVLRINGLFTFIRDITKTYGMVIDDSMRVGRFLSSFEGYPELALDYLMNKTPSLGMKKCFDNTPELTQIRNCVSHFKTYGKEDKEEGDQEDPDNFEIESEDTDESVDDQSSDNPDENADIDSSDPDDPFDDGMGSDDTSSTDTTSTTDTAGGIGPIVTDTQPADPSMLAYQVLTTNPSLDAIVYRKKTDTILKKLIANPPSSLSAEVVAILKVWLTEWLYIVSPSMTKRFLTLTLSGLQKSTL